MMSVSFLKSTPKQESSPLGKHEVRQPTLEHHTSPEQELVRERVIMQELRAQTSEGLRQRIVAAYNPETHNFDVNVFLAPQQPQTERSQIFAYLKDGKGGCLEPNRLINQLPAVTQDGFERFLYLRHAKYNRMVHHKEFAALCKLLGHDAITYLSRQELDYLFKRYGGHNGNIFKLAVDLQSVGIRDEKLILRLADAFQGSIRRIAMVGFSNLDRIGWRSEMQVKAYAKKTFPLKKEERQTIAESRRVLGLSSYKIASRDRIVQREGLTRRKFLKLCSFGLLSLGAKTLLSELPIGGKTEIEEITSKEKEALPLPKMVHNAEVYGLNQTIKAKDQIEKLSNHLNLLFERKGGVKSKDERYLEMVTTQSAYQSFSERRGETGADFVEWTKMHVDLLNRLMENAKPPSDIRIKLLRIIVVDDSFSDNPLKYYPNKDRDGSWFIQNDYRVNTSKETIQSKFWSFYHDESGNLIGRWPPGGDKTERQYSLPPKRDSLIEKDNVWLDLGLTHEWTHVLLNLPDEYLFDFEEAPFRFKTFRFDTGYNQEPRMSAFSTLRLEDLRKKERDEIKGGGVFGEVFGEVPKDIQVVIRDKSSVPIEKAKVFVIKPDKEHLKTEEDFFWRNYRPKIPKGPFYLTRDIWNSLTKEEVLKYSDREYSWFPTNFVIECEAGTLHLPTAAFNMTKWVGKEEIGKYNIEFTGFDDPNKKTQIVQLVDESEIQQYLKEHKKNNDPPYALMKVDGTSTYFVWLLRE